MSQQQSNPSPGEVFCTLSRTYNRLHNMRNDVDCPKHELREEIAFAESLEWELDNTIAPMHNMVFKAGFWAMLNAFITAQDAMFQEIATMHSTTLRHVKSLFWQGLLNAFSTLQNMHVPVKWWMRLPFMCPATATATATATNPEHVPIVVFGQEVALLRWRNRRGVIYVFEIFHRDDLEQLV